MPPTAQAVAVVLPAPVLQWLEHLGTGRRYSPHTLAAYRRDLQHLVELAGALPLDHVSSGHMRRFLGQLHARGMLPRTLARMLASWRGFYQWWAPQIGLPGNPAAGLRGPKAPRGLPKALSVEQTQALLDHQPGERGAVAAHQTEAERLVTCRDQRHVRTVLFQRPAPVRTDRAGRALRQARRPTNRKAGSISTRAK